jgi:hypothetical protein
MSSVATSLQPRKLLILVRRLVSRLVLTQLNHQLPIWTRATSVTCTMIIDQFVNIIVYLVFMFVKGLSVTTSPAHNINMVTPRRIYTQSTNKKLQYDFQKFHSPQITQEQIQLQ